MAKIQSALKQSRCPSALNNDQPEKPSQLASRLTAEHLGTWSAYGTDYITAILVFMCMQESSCMCEVLPGCSGSVFEL